MKLEKIRPWGRSKKDYEAMFGLDTWPKRILSVGDGPASFQKEMQDQGQEVISLDPIYQFTKAEIKEAIKESRTEIVEQLKLHYDEYDWSHYLNLDHLLQLRSRSMDLFIEDFERGKKAGSYVNGTVEDLPFENQSFDLALSSHFLLLYASHLDLDFHLKALREMLRVAKEVRIYPLVDLDCNPSCHLQPLFRVLEQEGVTVSKIPVAYRFQKGATECLILKSRP